MSWMMLGLLFLGLTSIWLGFTIQTSILRRRDKRYQEEQKDYWDYQ